MRQKHLRWNMPLFLLTCLLEAGYGVVSMCAAVMINEVANTVGTVNTIGELLRVGIPAVAFSAVYAGSRAIAEGMMLKYSERAGEQLRRRINRAIFSMDSARFAASDSGDYLNAMTGDVLLVQDQYYSQLPMMVCFVAQFVFCVIYSFHLNPVVAAVLTGMSAIQYFAPMMFGKKINELVMIQSQRSALFTSKAKELLFGFPVIRSYGAERQMQREFDDSNGSMTRGRERAVVMTRIMMCTNMMIAWAMILISVVVSGYFVIMGTMPFGTLLTVFYIANRYAMPVMDFAAAYTKVKGSRGVREKLDGFLERNPVAEASEGRAIRRGLSVRGLCFSYDGGARALEDVSFEFEAGRKYLLLGESGCGKSTLLKVLAGQYPSSGVRVDGEPLERLPMGALAGHLVLVGQQPYVFRRTVADNIDFLHTGDAARLADAAERCCLSDFLATLPQGIHTMVDEEQRQLSGGQKARIGLARAIYTQPEVLLLDEVTSALDAETAVKVERMILGLRDVLVIHVAHKPSVELMAQYDAVLTMDAGRIVEVRQN